MKRKRGQRKRPSVGGKCLGDFPITLDLFDCDKNNMRREEAAKIKAGSQAKYWWKCPKTNCDNRCDHSWKAPPHRMLTYVPTETSYGCPYCTHKRICICNSLSELRSDLMKEWDKEKNKLNPRNVALNSSIKA